MVNKERFREVLNEGLYKIKVNSPGKTMAIIQDEVGYDLGKNGGAAIEYYRKGNAPKIHDLEKLAECVFLRSDVADEWVIHLLEAGGHPYVEEASKKILLVASKFVTQQADASKLNASLPTKAFINLVGREGLLDQIVQTIQRGNAYSIIAIDGIGGIGKTALAREATDTLFSQNMAQKCVWLDLSGWGNNELITNSAGLIQSIGDKLKLWQGDLLDSKEKREMVRAALIEESILIVLDNMETLRSQQEPAIDLLKSIIGNSKAILTSRKRFVQDSVLNISLLGLSETASNQLVKI